jgi:hypothetical protein
MTQIQQIQLMISCPGDIKEEIDSLRVIIEEINKTSGRQSGYYIECLNWTTDTYTQIGEDAQEVINSQLDTKCDIVVAIMWQRIGTPTKRDKSGTIEEINRAIASEEKELLIYFKTEPPQSLNLIDLDQLSQINLFKEELKTKGVLFKEFNSVDNFESLFRINIINLINDKLLAKTSSQKALQIISKPKDDRYASISNLINEIEQKDEISSIELDIFELVEGVLSSLGIITASMESMTNSTVTLTNQMNNRTKELNHLINIKDNRLRMNKSQIVMDLLADELNEFNFRMNSELPRFSEHFSKVGHMYSRIVQYIPYYQTPDVDLKQSLLEYRDSIEGTTNQSATLLRQISDWPPATHKFNKSKRETEIALKNITKEMLEGLKLLDEALQL